MNAAGIRVRQMLFDMFFEVRRRCAERKKTNFFQQRQAVVSATHDGRRHVIIIFQNTEAYICILTVCKTPELGNHAISEDPVCWTSDCKNNLFQQSDNTWTAFTQDSSDEHQDVMGQWWPTSAVEESRDFINHSVVTLKLKHFFTTTPSGSGHLSPFY